MSVCTACECMGFGVHMALLRSLHPVILLRGSNHVGELVTKLALKPFFLCRGISIEVGHCSNQLKTIQTKIYPAIPRPWYRYAYALILLPPLCGRTFDLPTITQKSSSQVEGYSSVLQLQQTKSK